MHVPNVQIPRPLVYYMHLQFKFVARDRAPFGTYAGSCGRGKAARHAVKCTWSGAGEPVYVLTFCEVVLVIGSGLEAPWV